MAMSVPVLAEIPGALLPLSGTAVTAFFWLLVQTVVPRRAGWISAVALPAILAVGSALTLFPQALALFSGGGSPLARFGALGAAAVAGLCFDRASRLEFAGLERVGKRSGWPLALWGMGALLFAGAPALGFAPKLSAWAGSVGSALGSTSVFALLGQALGWSLRLRSKVASLRPAAAVPAAPISQRGRFPGAVLAAIAVVLLLRGPSGGGGAVAPGTFLLADGTPLKNGDVVVAGSNGATLHTLPVKGSAARWSADGLRLAWVRAEPSEIWTAAADGSGAQRIYRTSGYITDLAWSGDGRRIFFAHRTGFLGGGLLAIAAEGGTAETLLPEAEGVDCPAVSPDGRWIAYFRGADITQMAQPPQGIKLLDPATKQTRSVIMEQRWSITGLGWTRDGSAIVVSSLDSAERQCRLERIDLQRPTREPLMGFLDYRLIHLSALADRDSIALLAIANGGSNRPAEMWVVDAHTGSRTVLNAAPAIHAFSLQASPAGAGNAPVTPVDYAPSDAAPATVDQPSTPGAPPLGHWEHTR